MSSIGFGLTSGNVNGGSVSQTASPMLLSPNNGQSRCGMHESHTTGGRSSVGSNSVGGTGSASGDNFSSGKISGGMNDCSIAAAAAAATALVQNSCAKSNRDDYENSNRKNNMGVGGSNNNVSYSDFTARQMTPIGTSGANGESGGVVTVPTLSHSGSGGSKSRLDTGIPDDSKLLANPKGIIKSFLPQAAACDSQKFDAYRELCLAHADEYYKNQKGGAMWAVCHVCNSTHPHWNTLQRHLQTHIDFRPFVCDQCGRTFYSQSKLKRHQVIHNEVKPYKCPVCDRRLGRTEHLKRHLLVHTDDKPYGCSSCAHTTKRLDGIRRHIKRKHGIGGAEIVVLSARAESQTLSDLRQVMSAIDESEQRGQKPKKKKKKKKKKSESNPNQNMQQQQQQQQQQQAEMDSVNSKDYGGNLLEVAARFGLSDLRLPGSGGGGGISSAADSDRGGFDNATNGGGGGGSGAGGQSKDGKNSFHEGGHGGRGSGGRSAENLSVVDEMKPSWDGGLLLGGLPTQQMHLLYHSLARSHPAAHGDGTSMGGGIGSGPCNLSGNNDAGGVGTSANNLRQPSFCHDRAPMSSPDHTFIMNSSSVPMRYLPSVGVADNNPARHVNPMLFSPRSSTRNLGHFGATDMNMPAEAMISQYIQSQQRFAPPVWGFANPNYHNY